MRFLLVAILFVIAVAVFTLVTKLGYQKSLESEFSKQAKAALDAAGLTGVEVGFNHHNAELTGYVESQEEHERALQLVAEALPMAVVPPIEESAIAIDPTLPPVIRIERKEDSTTVTINGLLSINGEANRELIGGRLHAVDGVETVDNLIEFDPKQLPFPKTAELASLAESLLRHPGAASIAFEDGKLLIKGTVPNAGLKEGLLELANLIQADAIEDQIFVPEPVRKLQPSHFSLTRNRFGLTLSGTVGTTENRDALFTVIRSVDTSIEVKDRLEINDEYVPGVWEENSATVLPAVLGNLKGELTAEFTPERARLNGRVETENDLETVQGVFRDLIAGPDAPSLLLDIDVREGTDDGTPVRMLAVFREGILTFTGIVPSIGFYTALESEIERKEGQMTLVNELEESPDSAGKEWVDRLTELFIEFDGRLESAIVTIENQTIKLEGVTLEPAAIQLLQNVVINIIPGSYSVENRLKNKVEEPPPVPELTPEEWTELEENLKELPIYFGSNSEVVNSEGAEKIEKIATLIKESEVPLNLLVTGFADNVGNAAYNRELSLRRATAVITAMVAQGITKDTMSSDSVGEDVSNVSRSERWKARRVEVSLIKDSPEDAEAEDEENEP